MGRRRAQQDVPRNQQDLASQARKFPTRQSLPGLRPEEVALRALMKRQRKHRKIRRRGTLRKRPRVRTR